MQELNVNEKMFEYKRIKVISVECEPIKNVDKLFDKCRIIGRKHNIDIQLLDAEMVFGKTHILSGIDRALRAYKHQRNVASTLVTEILVRLSGEKQIHHALKKVGVKKGTNRAILIIEGDCEIRTILNELNFRHTRISQGTISNLLRFGISKKELETVERTKVKDLVLEKVATRDIID
jgi:tRNA threonylcarbamoyladenosine modification (KEOPS) complex Cgi121 subunit